MRWWPWRRRPATAPVPPPGVPATASAIAPVAPAGTTLARTLLLGPAGAGGYRPIVAGPGEPHLRRLD